MALAKLFPLIRPALFALEPERAHHMALAALARSNDVPPAQPGPLAVDVAGIHFPNPVGMGAGFDKDAKAYRGLLGLGFGFVEVGTITPRPQDGNPHPRLFRLSEDRAIINRMGFNNDGLEAAKERLEARPPADQRGPQHGIVGVNVGANKDSSDRIGDYAEMVRAVAPYADYITVNISSPNTPGLRGLQDEGELEALLSAVSAERDKDDPPIFLKVAPDQAEGAHRHIIRAAIDHRFDALIVSNTTISRPNLRSSQRDETGGLSGAPLKALALEQLRLFYQESGGEIPLIGVGGIENGDDAWERICAGASLVQVYSAMIYEGPGLVKKITDRLAQLLDQSGFASVADAVGSA